MNDKRKEYLKKWREDNKAHIREYKKEYSKTHDSSFKKLQDKYKQMQQENKQLKDNWDELKEYIGIKLYNVEYLQKLCGCRIDDEIHIILDIIKKKMQELENRK